MRFIIIIISLIWQNELSAQILNGSFDDWEIISMFGEPYENPVSWTTNNDNESFGFSNTPVTKGIDSSGFYARVESNYGGIDALLPGELSQTISSNNLVKINFHYKCDSIFQSGRCVVNILGQEQNVLFTDSISIEDFEFKSGAIEIQNQWNLENDSITIQFVAKGNIDMWDKEVDGHSIFLIDNVTAEYITNTEEHTENLKAIVFPNPTYSEIHVLSSNVCQISLIEIYSITGQRILTDKHGDSIDLSWVPNGMYIISMTCENETLTERIIVFR